MTRSAAAVALRCLLIAALLTGAIFCVRFARAAFLFEQDTAVSIAKAAALVRFNSAYVEHLAAWQPERKMALLQRAVQLNPFNVDAWIQLGLISEMERHDAASAERYFLRAAEVDHMFLPKWTLTNFYFRQQNAAEFFRWARATLQISPYSPDPVFTQMWLMSQDASQIARAIPDRGGVLLAYAGFLANAHQYQAVAPVVARLVAVARNHNPVDYGRDDQIGPLEDRLLDSGNVQPALDIWRSMSQGKWIQLPVPNALHPLTNGDFAVPFFRHGFDWIPISSADAMIQQSPAEKCVRITLSGSQPEHCVLLRQYLPGEANRRYRLTWNANTEGMQVASGLAWHLYPAPNERQSELVSSDLFASNKNWEFVSPPTGLALLSLEYTRPLGSVRATGTAVLGCVSLAEE